jgi:hypothetical protein
VFEIGKIDNIESRLVRRLEDDGRRADSWPQQLNRASSGLSQVEDHVRGLTVYIAHPAVRDGHAPTTIIDQVEDSSIPEQGPTVEATFTSCVLGER